MKHAISILVAVLLVAGLAARADADGTIASLSADRASPGAEIVITGTDFGGRGNKVVAVFFAEPTPLSYYVYLDVVDWSSSSINVRIPSLTSNAYRSRSSVISDPDGDPEAFPEEVRNYLASNDVRGDLGIRVPHPLGLQNFSNEVDFTMTRASSSDVTMAPPRYKLPEDEPDIAIAKPPSSTVFGRIGEGPKIEAKAEPMVATIEQPFGAIDSVMPERAPMGAMVTVRGLNFGVQADRNLSLYFKADENEFYIDLDVISWRNDEIVARIPGYDSIRFRFEPFLSRSAIPPTREGLKSMFMTKSLLGVLGILKPDGEFASNYLRFQLMPIPDKPEIYVLDGTVSQSDILNIYGIGLGERKSPCAIFHSKSIFTYYLPFGVDSTFDIDNWKSTSVSTKVPADAPTGVHYIWLRNGAGEISNKVRVIINERIEVPAGGMEREDEDRDKLKTRPIRKIEGDVPLRLEE